MLFDIDEVTIVFLGNYEDTNWQPLRYETPIEIEIRIILISLHDSFSLWFMLTKKSSCSAFKCPGDLALRVLNARDIVISLKRFLGSEGALKVHIGDFLINCMLTECNLAVLYMHNRFSLSHIGGLCEQRDSRHSSAISGKNVLGIR